MGILTSKHFYLYAIGNNELPMDKAMYHGINPSDGETLNEKYAKSKLMEIICRNYIPDLEKMKTWKAHKADKR
jgi:hypothetical protein